MSAGERIFIVQEKKIKRNVTKVAQQCFLKSEMTCASFNPQKSECLWKRMKHYVKDRDALSSPEILLFRTGRGRNKM